MLRALLYHQERNELQPLAREELLDCSPENEEAARKRDMGDMNSLHTGVPQCREKEFLWVDAVAPDENEYQLLASRFHLHAMVLEDMKAREGRPKLHNYDEYLYLIFHAIEYSSGAGEHELKLHEIDCLVGPDYVLTIHDENLQPLEDLANRWKAHPSLMKPGPAYLLYEIMDEVLDDYFPALDVLDERIDHLETKLFADDRTGDQKITADIFSLKRNLLQIRHIAGPTRDVVNILLRRDAETGGKNFAYFQDLYDHAVRIVDMTDTFRDVLSGALDAYLAVESNRMNAVMKTLTSASIMLLIPTLIAGIYGMNFEFMPELHARYGYYGAVGAMLTSTVVLYTIFKRKNWL
jgi:magnesium transporter